MRLFIVAIFLFISTSAFVNAQGVQEIYEEGERDTLLATPTDTYAADRFNPRKASLYAAILPGLGQAYNKKYWKIPLVYGGFIALGYGIDFYHDNYTRFRSALIAEVDNNPMSVNETGFNTEQLRRLVDRTRRERDYFIILTGAFYLLQIVDAHIDAHLKEFDLNPDLKVQVDPVMRYQEGINGGLSLTLKF